MTRLGIRNGFHGQIANFYSAKHLVMTNESKSLGSQYEIQQNQTTIPVGGGTKI